MKTLIIIPAYNEASVIESVINSVKKVIKQQNIIVIDDGSTDKTKQNALKTGVKVISHPINRGLGGAIGTGLTYAKDNQYDIAVTFDADGQHDPKDISKVVKPIISKKADLVIGSRVLKYSHQVPVDRRIMIAISNVITFLLFDFKTSDSLSGFRALSKKALASIKIKTQTMEVSNEVFSQIKKYHLKYAEIPINVKYTKYSRQKGQSNSNALNVGIKLIFRLFR